MKGHYYLLLWCLTRVPFIFLLKPVESAPISATIHRSLDDDDRPRSTVRMAFGNGGSTQITAHSSHGAVSSLHDVIDLHRQVKKTISNIRGFVRSRKQERVPPSSSVRMNAYHPYARTGKPAPHNSGNTEEHSHERYNPHLQHNPSTHPHEMHEIHPGQGQQARPQVLVQHPGQGDRKSHYSMAVESPFRGNYGSQKAQHVQ